MSELPILSEEFVQFSLTSLHVVGHLAKLPAHEHTTHAEVSPCARSRLLQRAVPLLDGRYLVALQTFPRTRAANARSSAGLQDACLQHAAAHARAFPARLITACGLADHGVHKLFSFRGRQTDKEEKNGLRDA